MMASGMRPPSSLLCDLPHPQSSLRRLSSWNTSPLDTLGGGGGKGRREGGREGVGREKEKGEVRGREGKKSRQVHVNGRGTCREREKGKERERE